MMTAVMFGPLPFLLAHVLCFNEVFVCLVPHVSHFFRLFQLKRFGRVKIRY